MTLDAMIQEQTPVRVLVRLLSGELRTRFGIITSYDGNVVRVFDVTVDGVGAVKGFRSVPSSHLIQIMPIPERHPIYRLIRDTLVATYAMGY